jgi:hypothetical protein
MVIPIDAEKGFDMIKALKKLRLEGMYFNVIKARYDRPIANIILS